MRGVTGIHAAWLPSLCPASTIRGEPLSEPEPRYSEAGRVTASYRPTWGQLGWPLPVTELEMEAGLDKYKWFGRFFLEGKVIQSLDKYRTSLLSNPLIMVKSWSNLQKRTELLVRELVISAFQAFQAILLPSSPRPWPGSRTRQTGQAARHLRQPPLDYHTAGHQEQPPQLGQVHQDQVEDDVNDLINFSPQLQYPPVINKLKILLKIVELKIIFRFLLSVYQIIKEL